MRSRSDSERAFAGKLPNARSTSMNVAIPVTGRVLAYFVLGVSSTIESGAYSCQVENRIVKRLATCFLPEKISSVMGPASQGLSLRMLAKLCDKTNSLQAWFYEHMFLVCGVNAVGPCQVQTP